MRKYGFHQNKTVLGRYRLGQQVSQQFPRNINCDGWTTIITGEIVKLWETRNAGWAIIKQKDDVKRLVCIG